MKEPEQEAKRKRRKRKKGRKSRKIFQTWGVSLVNISSAMAMLLGLAIYLDARMDKQEERLVARMERMENRLVTRIDGLETRLDGLGKQIFALAQDIGVIKGDIGLIKRVLLGLEAVKPEPGSQQSDTYQSGASSALPLPPTAFMSSRAF